MKLITVCLPRPVPSLWRCVPSIRNLSLGSRGALQEVLTTEQGSCVSLCKHCGLVPIQQPVFHHWSQFRSEYGTQHLNTSRFYSSESSSTKIDEPTTASHRQEDSRHLTDREIKMRKLAVIIGPIWFVILMYWCFFKEEKEGGIMDYLSQDPRYNDRLPDDVKQKAREVYGDSSR